MNRLSWDQAEKLHDELLEEAEPVIEEIATRVKQYQAASKMASEEKLAALLTRINLLVHKTGELQPRAALLKEWTDKRWEIEKSLQVIRIHRDEGKAISFATAAKYEQIQDLLDVVANCNALQMRLQNARSTARDAADGIRQRISQIKGMVRSS